MVETKFFIGIAVGLISLFSLALILQTVNAKDVQIIENRIGGSGGCTDLECLSDIEFDNPPNPQLNQILTYNGTLWHNAFDIPTGFQRVCQLITSSGTTTSIQCIPSSDANLKQFERFFVVIEGNITSSTYRPALRFNFPADTGTNYSYQSSTNLGAYNTGTDQTSCNLIPTSVTNAGDRFLIYFWMTNEDTQRKLVIGKMVYGADTNDSTLQTSIDFTCKWDNTTGGTFGFNAIQLTRISGTGSLGKGSIITGWGFTPYNQ